MLKVVFVFIGLIVIIAAFMTLIVVGVRRKKAKDKAAAETSEAIARAKESKG